MLILKAFIVLSSFILALICLAFIKEAYDTDGKFGLFLHIFGVIFFNWLAVEMIIANCNLYKNRYRYMKEFTLEKYLKDTTQEVIRRDGNSVKIIYTELKNPDYPIIGIVNRKGCNDIVNTYTKDGKVCFGEINNDDLFFKTRKQTRWIYLYKGVDGDEFCSALFNEKEDAEKSMEQVNGFGLTEITWEE